MIKRFPLGIILMLCPYFLCAQSSGTGMGARAGGLGFAGTCLSDEWSLFNNIGGLSKIKSTTVAVSYDAQPSFMSFNKMAAAIAVPLSLGVAGFGIHRFGDNIYNEHLLTAGYSNTFGLASLGLSVNYVQYKVSGFGRKGVVSLSFGGLATLTPKLSFGAYVINLTQPIISDVDNERLPTILSAGISFKASATTLIVAEIQKDLLYTATWKAGLEHQIYKKLAFRTGFNIHPNAAFFGLGFKTRKFTLDFGYAYRNHLGSRLQATVCRAFNHDQL